MNFHRGGIHNLELIYSRWNGLDQMIQGFLWYIFGIYEEYAAGEKSLYFYQSGTRFALALIYIPAWYTYLI